jgi:hypothetical protein
MEIIMHAKNLELAENQNIRRFALPLALAIVAMIMFSVSHPVQAQGTQGILDAGKSMLGGSSSGAPAVGGATGIAGALPLDKIMSLLQSQGYTNITGLAPSPSGDTLKASALNKAGSPVNLLINPTTGGVISALTK